MAANTCVQCGGTNTYEKTNARDVADCAGDTWECRDCKESYSPEEPVWKNNEIQFARVLCEMSAIGIPDGDAWADLCENMDLTPNDLDELFERAHEVWEKSKRENA